MLLKVTRYKNYGCTITSEDYEDKFYFSFYELNNGKIIVLSLFENSNVTQYDFSNTTMMLKNGEIRDYKFGNARAIDKNEMSKEFFEWFDSSPPAKDVVSNNILNNSEEKCVKDFYLKNIKPFKLIQTDTIEVELN